MAHILVVCTANICRSPVGEVILRDRLQRHGLEDWTARSAGTWATPGHSASRYSVEVVAEQGLDLSNHQSQMIEEHHLRETDLVLCMGSSHVEALRAEFPAHAAKIYLLSEMIDKRYGINDPIGLPLDAYQSMVAEVTDIIDAGLARIITLASANVGHRQASDCGGLNR